MSVEDIDQLFYLLENPTRRRILELLSREQLYPLQISREIAVSQQAVMKHLRILKEHGIVSSRDEPSDRGPTRHIYRATRAVSLQIDVGPSSYREQAEAVNLEGEVNPELHRMRHGIMAARDMESAPRLELLQRIANDLDTRLVRLERERHEMVSIREVLNREMSEATRCTDCDREHRRVLHYALLHPAFTVEAAATALGLSESAVRGIVHQLRQQGLLRSGRTHRLHPE